MKIELFIPDDQVDSFARFTGWRDQEVDSLNPGQFVMNPTSQEQWCANVIQQHVVTMVISMVSDPLIQAAKLAALNSADQQISSIKATVTTPVQTQQVTSQ